MLYNLYDAEYHNNYRSCKQNCYSRDKKLFPFLNIFYQFHDKDSQHDKRCECHKTECCDILDTNCFCHYFSHSTSSLAIKYDFPIQSISICLSSSTILKIACRLKCFSSKLSSFNSLMSICTSATT